ncbi:methylmalonyl-CoA mutase family protein [uncultured Serinicoccus sp.]|uniref:methylmalonyl-CoA mutase family protein n=1 Tax=uncultured Serinicoccus sp. TaxID=735514 RepID=UPI00260F4B7C|nr:methylmalonyl-CoA mutase family protein [uncultured Serinicoccus sp.]
MEETIQPAEDVVDALPEVLALASTFPAATREQWEEQVVRVLNRRRPADRQLSAEQCLDALRTRTVDGLTIEPLYPPVEGDLGEPGVAPFRRGATVRTGGAWDVRALHDDPDTAAGAEAVLTDLERGVTSLWVRVGAGAVAPADLGRLLSGVELGLAPVVVSSEDDQGTAARALLAVSVERGMPLAPGSNLGLDPLAHAAVTGTPVDVAGVGELTRRVVADHPGVRAVTVDACVYHDAGGSDVDELALAVAAGISHLRVLEAAGVGPEQAADQLDFRVSAGADQFLTIARLRALRVLWARVLQECGVPAARRGARQHAVTSWRMLTRDDPWVNMLRATTATFAAAAGGAEAVTVLPFDHVHGYPDAVSRRVARNTQVVLAEEAGIGRVTDPAGGSGYVESLTDDLAARAWELVQRVEAEGGLIRALDHSSLVQEVLAASREERARRVADRTAPLTGVSSFPATDEAPLARVPRLAPVTGGLPRVRDAAVFEALRDRSRAHEQEHGAPPQVLLVGIGTRRDFGARETFTVSLLAAAGIRGVLVEVVDGDTEVLRAAVRDVGSPVAILTSSAERYAEHGPALARALREAGAATVLLAGSERELGDTDERPSYADTSEDAGADDRPDAPLVDGTVRAGMDVVAFLDDLLDTLEVAR